MAISDDKDTVMTQILDEPGPAEDLFERKHTVGQRIHEVLHRLPWLSPLVVLILACIVFGIVSDRFFKAGNLSILLQFSGKGRWKDSELRIDVDH